MSEYQPANLENLFVKRAGKRMRVASCDPTGGNNDNVLIPSGETYLFADLQGPGIVTHFFCTIGNQQLKPRPSSGVICRGALAKLFVMPWPMPKKSPRGAWMLGSVSSSQ